MWFWFLIPNCITCTLQHKLKPSNERSVKRLPAAPVHIVVQTSGCIGYTSTGNEESVAASSIAVAVHKGDTYRQADKQQ